MSDILKSFLLEIKETFSCLPWLIFIKIKGHFKYVFNIIHFLPFRNKQKMQIKMNKKGKENGISSNRFSYIT